MVSLVTNLEKAWLGISTPKECSLPSAKYYLLSRRQFGHPSSSSSSLLLLYYYYYYY